MYGLSDEDLAIQSRARSFADEHFDAEKALARYDAWIDRIVVPRR